MIVFMIINGHKICGACKKSLSLSSFYTSKYGDGYQSICKKCSSRKCHERWLSTHPTRRKRVYMKSITSTAKEIALRRKTCNICPISDKCTPEIERACFDSYVEGFKKGAKREREIWKKKSNQ